MVVAQVLRVRTERGLTQKIQLDGDNRGFLQLLPGAGELGRIIQMEGIDGLLCAPGLHAEGLEYLRCDVLAHVLFPPADDDGAKKFPEAVNVANLGAAFLEAAALAGVGVIDGLTGKVALLELVLVGELLLGFGAIGVGEACGGVFGAAIDPFREPEDVLQPVLDGGRGEDKAGLGIQAANSGAGVAVGALEPHAFIDFHAIEQIRNEPGEGGSEDAADAVLTNLLADARAVFLMPAFGLPAAPGNGFADFEGLDAVALDQFRLPFIGPIHAKGGIAGDPELRVAVAGGGVGGMGFRYHARQAKNAEHFLAAGNAEPSTGLAGLEAGVHGADALPEGDRILVDGLRMGREVGAMAPHFLPGPACNAADLVMIRVDADGIDVFPSFLAGLVEEGLDAGDCGSYVVGADSGVDDDGGAGGVEAVDPCGLQDFIVIEIVLAHEVADLHAEEFEGHVLGLLVQGIGGNDQDALGSHEEGADDLGPCFAKASGPSEDCAIHERRAGEVVFLEVLDVNSLFREAPPEGEFVDLGEHGAVFLVPDGGHVLNLGNLEALNEGAEVVRGLGWADFAAIGAEVQFHLGELHEAVPGAALIGDGNHEVLAGDENILFLAVDVGLRLVTPDLHRLGSDLVRLPGLECGVAGEGIAQVFAALERLVFIHVADALDFREGIERGAAGVIEADGFFDQRRELGIDKPHVAIDGGLQRLAGIALDNEGHRGLAFEQVEGLNQLLRDATGEGLERREMPVDDLVLVDPDIERALALAVAGLVFVAGGVPIAPCGHRAIGLELPLDAGADHVAVGLDVTERGFGARGGIGLGGAVLDLPIPAMVAGEVEDGGINGIAVLEDAAGDREPEPNVLAAGHDALHLSFRRGGGDSACPATEPKYLRAIVSERMMYPSPLVLMNSKAMRKVATPELMRQLPLLTATVAIA